VISAFWSWSAAPPKLIDTFRSQIAHYKAPDTIEFAIALPRTSTGKLQKYELRARTGARARTRRRIAQESRQDADDEE